MAKNNDEQQGPQGPQVNDTANAPLSEVALQSHEAPEKGTKGEFPNSADTGNIFTDGLDKKKNKK